jgi:hypothetical protein
MQVSSISPIVSLGSGAGISVRQLLAVANVFSDEKNQSFETKRAAWFEYQRMTRELAHGGAGAPKFSKEWLDSISDTVEGSDFARNIDDAQKVFNGSLHQDARNPHDDAIKAADGLNEQQKAYFEIGLLDSQGLTFSEWRDKQGAMSDILETLRMASSDTSLGDDPKAKLLKVLKTLYDRVGANQVKPGDIKWPDGTAPYLDKLAQCGSLHSGGSQEPKDVVELSLEGVAQLRRQSESAWSEGPAYR